MPLLTIRRNKQNATQIRAFWRTAAGSTILIKDLGGEHLVNIARMLRRRFTEERLAHHPQYANIMTEISARGLYS